MKPGAPPPQSTSVSGHLRGLLKFRRILMIEQYLAAKATPAETEGRRWARKTTYSVGRGGAVERRIERADGQVEHKSVYTALEWELMGARAKTGLSQTEFAKMIGVSTRTLQGWEQGRKKPSGAAQALLRIAASRPDVVRAVLLPAP
jgi:DNA-binding transcriptional regulator YiaG